MSRKLIIRSAGPSTTVQDLGRDGYLAQGLSMGGAADRQAMAEGAALLGQAPGLAALEMAGFGGVFEAGENFRIALTGAPMRAAIDGEGVLWNASHAIHTGQRLSIGAAIKGVYGYLHIGGGIDTPTVLGSRSAHLSAGIGALCASGDKLPIGAEARNAPPTGMALTVDDRFSGGLVRMVPSAQTDRFSRSVRARFETTVFTRDTRGNRQGVRLVHDTEPFGAEQQLSILSEIIVPGDIQMTGDGTPYVLLAECQTMGGYPRIATIVPDDLSIVAQAAPGTRLQFRLISMEVALDAYRQLNANPLRRLASRIAPIVRDPREMRDLLSYQLIGGVISGSEPDDQGE